MHPKKSIKDKNAAPFASPLHAGSKGARGEGVRRRRRFATRSAGVDNKADEIASRSLSSRCRNDVATSVSKYSSAVAREE